MRNFRTLLVWLSAVAFFALPEGVPCVWAVPISLASRVNTIWLTQNGLPQNTIKSIVQTRDGYLWVATRDGIARFDGSQFRVFNTRNTPGLATNNIEQLLEDNHGTLWAAGVGGLTRFDHGEARDVTPVPQSENIRNVRCQLDPSGGLWAEEGGEIFQNVNGKLVQRFNGGDYLGASTLPKWAPGTDGTVWVAGDEGVLFQVHAGEMRRHLFGETINSLQCSTNGDLWIGSDRGVDVIRRGILRHFVDRKVSSVSATVKIDGTGRVWVLTARRLFRMIGDRLIPDTEWAKFSIGEIDLSSNSHLICRYGKTLATGHSYDKVALCINGDIWVCASIDDGMSGTATCALQDCEGNVWIGTEAGLNCLRDRIGHTFGQREGLPALPVTCLFNDAGEHFFVSCPTSGLYRYSGGPFGRFQRVGPTNYRWSSLVETPNGVILGLQNGRTMQLVDNRLVDRSHVYGNSLVGPATTILTAKNGDVWLTGHSKFVRTRRGQHLVIRASTAENHFSNSYLDLEGRFWASGKDGLYCYNGRKLLIFQNSDGVPGIPIVSIYQQADGVLWFGHLGGGLTRYKNGAFTHIDMRGGLYSDGIYQILEDLHKNLWIGSSSGIFRVSSRELNAYLDSNSTSRPAIHCDVYGPADGANDGGCYTGEPSTCYRTGDGALWFSGMNGLVRIDPNNLYPVSVPVLIESVVIDGRSYSPNEETSVVPGHGNVQIQFTALDYQNPAHLEFEYQLEGFDASWAKCDGLRLASYTNLPPGNYRFQMRCTNTETLWHGAASFEFILQPHYYETWWFKAAIALLMFAGAVGLSFAVMKSEHIKRHNRKLQEVRELLEAHNEELIASQHEVLESRQALEEANERLYALATTDGLTGLTNHRTFQENLANELQLTKRDGLSLSLILLDVDHFKSFNDTFGHPAGDVVLKSMGRLLREHVRSVDTAARYGGEEFVLILHGTDANEARIVAERFRHSIAETQWPNRAISVSMGIATLNMRVHEPADMIEQADMALYWSKDHGRDCVTHYDDIILDLANKVA